MKYVELRTGPTADSARTGDDLGAVRGQSPRSTSEELRNYRPNEKKRGRHILTVRREGSRVVSDSLRDGLLAKSGLGRRAGVAGHTRKSPRTIDKSSPSHVPNSTTPAAAEVVA